MRSPPLAYLPYSVFVTGLQDQTQLKETQMFRAVEKITASYFGVNSRIRTGVMTLARSDVTTTPYSQVWALHPLEGLLRPLMK